MSFDAVDLFAGAGGWDVGAEALGLSTIGIEWDGPACDTRRAAGLPTVQGDVREYGPKDFPNVRGLIASPPCQTFSSAGKGSGRASLDEVLALIRWMELRQDVSHLIASLSDDRTGLVLEPLRWVLAAIDAGEPFEWLAFEQVKEVLPVWEAMAEVLRREGCSVATGILNSAHFGVPQQRKRSVLIARSDREVRLPQPSVPRTRVIEDVLPERRGWEMHGLRGAGLTARYGSRPGRRSDQPSFTIMAWKDSRLVWTRDGEREAPSTRELALLQTFPAGYPFQGSATTQHKQIGNAVPPLLASAVLAQVAQPIEDEESIAA